MIKTILIPNMILFYPIILNMIIISLMMMPSKFKKSHPLILMFILIMLTLLISNKMNFIYKSWMNFILFLAMIGGLMIIFMYITSLTNNELLYQSFKMILINLLKILPMILLILYVSKNFNLINQEDSWTMECYMMIYNHLNMNTFFKEINNKSTYFMMLYIYYTMICIMNICYKLKAPLRKLMF